MDQRHRILRKPLITAILVVAAVVLFSALPLPTASSDDETKAAPKPAPQSGVDEESAALD